MNSRPISPKFPPLNRAANRENKARRNAAEVERVVLNALAKVCGFAAGYPRLRRTKWHRLAAASRSTFTAVLSDRTHGLEQLVSSLTEGYHPAGKMRPVTSPKPMR